MPTSPLGRKFVHSGRKKFPAASSGAPRTIFPSAAPKSIASSALAPAKITSRTGDQQVNNARSDVIPVEHYISGEHHRDKAEPDGFHDYLLRTVLNLAIHQP